MAKKSWWNKIGIGILVWILLNIAAIALFFFFYIGKPADKGLASVVQEMWVNFAKTGDPSTSEYKWERYDETDRKTMILGDKIHMEEDPMPQQRTLTEPLLKYRFNGYFSVVDYSIMYLRRRVRRAAPVLLGVNAVVLIVRWFLKRRKG